MITLDTFGNIALPPIIISTELFGNILIKKYDNMEKSTVLKNSG